MAKISIKNLARAIFESSKGKEGESLNSIIEKTGIFIRNNNLLGKKDEILLALEDIINKENGTVKAKVSTSFEMDESTKKEIEDFIKKRYTAKNVVMDSVKNPKLLGGIKIEIGDQVIDATVSNKVSQLQDFLIKN